MVWGLEGAPDRGHSFDDPGMYQPVTLGAQGIKGGCHLQDAGPLFHRRKQRRDERLFAG